MNKDITFVIPFKNEELNIKRNISMYKNIASKYNLVLINDNSIDNTFTLLKSINKAKVVTVSQNFALNKKVNALMHLEHVTTEFIVFLDADVKISELDCFISKIKNVNFQTFLPKFNNFTIVDSFALYFQLAMYYNFQLQKEISYSFGGCLIFKSEFYYKLKPHCHVRDKLVEDLEIAKYLSGFTTIEFNESNSISIKMYESIFEIYNGFLKNISAGLKNLDLKATLVIVMMIIIQSLIFTLLVLNLNLAIIFYFIITILNIILCKKVMNIRKEFILLWPIYLIFFIVVNIHSIFKKKVVWSGNVYNMD